MMGNLIFLAAVLLLALIGAVFLALAVVTGKRQKQRTEKCTHKTTARVVEMRRITNRDNYSTPTTSWFPVYEYCVGSQRIEKQSLYGHDRQIFYEGQVLELYYDPEDINEFYVPAEKTEKLKWIMCLVGAILIACSGVAMIIYNILL